MYTDNNKILLREIKEYKIKEYESRWTFYKYKYEDLILINKKIPKNQSIETIIFLSKPHEAFFVEIRNTLLNLRENYKGSRIARTIF